MKKEQFNEEEGFITLSLDGNRELECQIVTILEAQGQDYIVLYPLDKNYQNSDGEVFIYRYFEDEAGEVLLENIETDEEFEIISDVFDEFLDSCEYDEIVGSDELEFD